MTETASSSLMGSRKFPSEAVPRPIRGRARPVERTGVRSVLSITRRSRRRELGRVVVRGDPFDKAGAYAIQDETLRPVERFDGCYCNVVGLSLWATIELLRKADVDVSAVSESDLLPQCALCPLRPQAL